MAKKAPQTAAEDIPNIDFSAFLPEGFEAKDLETIGGLLPTTSPESMRDNPVAGWLIAQLNMPPRPDDGSAWSALLIELTGATRAKVGTEENVAVEAGKRILVPVSGNLQNNAQLVDAALDGDNIHLVILQQVGQVDTGKPSPMWNFKVQKHPKTRKRTQREMQAHAQATLISAKAGEGRKGAAPELPAGSLTNAATGEPIRNVVQS